MTFPYRRSACGLEARILFNDIRLCTIYCCCFFIILKNENVKKEKRKEKRRVI